MSTASAGEALDRLVNQFSDPLSFYRELIQNAIDAGSTEVEITLAHHDGVMTIHVDDWGEGMNREIIDTRLTRLFSSRKDGDLTKIGKFGIGFVSVFAIAPDAVNIDTSREGESWRVLFDTDRSFDCFRRDELLEGTKITIIKQVGDEEYAEIERRTREMVAYWCKFVGVEVRVQGQTISRPFALDSPCQVRHREKGTEIVVGYPQPGEEPTFGFYNQGLTLLEGTAQRSQRASMIINSRYLEHTLARDDVRQDDSYFKVLRIAERLVRDDLPRQLAEQLSQALTSGSQEQLQEGGLLDSLACCLKPERQWSWPAPELHHGGGHQEGSEWVAIPGQDRLDRAAHLVYGPYTRQIPAGRYRVQWLLAAADAAADGKTPVAQLDVFDANRGKTITRRTLLLRHFNLPEMLQPFTLDFTARDRQKLEFRTLWHETIPLRQGAVTVTGGKGVDVQRSVFRDLPLWPSSDGRQRLTIGQVAAAVRRDRLVAATADSPLTQALQDDGYLVVLDHPGSGSWQVLEALCGGAPPDANQGFCRPELLEEGTGVGSWPDLKKSLQGLLRGLGVKTGGVVPARFDTPGSCIADWVAVAQTEPGAVSELTTVGRLGRGLLSSRRTLVVNLAHPAVERLLSIAENEPELAAYLLQKLFHLRGELNLQGDAELAKRAWGLRCSRLNG